MMRFLTSTESLAGMTHNLNEIYLDENPFNERTILRLVSELSSGLSQSAMKVSLSLGLEVYRYWIQIWKLTNLCYLAEPKVYYVCIHVHVCMHTDLHIPYLLSTTWMTSIYFKYKISKFSINSMINFHYYVINFNIQLKTK